MHNQVTAGYAIAMRTPDAPESLLTGCSDSEELQPLTPVVDSEVLLEKGAEMSCGGSATALPPLDRSPHPAAGAVQQAPGQRRKPGVLILMTDTGGGHRASAEAIKEGFEELYGSAYHIDVLDIWKLHTPYPFNLIPKSYSFLVKHAILWRAIFWLTQPRWVHVATATLSTLWIARRLSEAFDLYRPDLVVSVHPLMQHAVLRVMHTRIRSGLQRPTKFATVVTDLTTCHNTWFCPGVDRCYVATEASRRQGLCMGLAPSQLRMYGLPIRPAFDRTFPAKPELRRWLGMDVDKPAILVVGGGEGMGPVERTVDEVVQHVGSACQLVVICGRNARLMARLQSKQYPVGMHLMVHGFVTNMPELMSASDLIVTKAGPGTISEALICGLPMLLNAYVPCQEEGNIRFVTENKVGVFEKNPKRAAQIIRGWFGERRGELQEMATRAKALGTPHALFDICRDLASLVPCTEAAPAFPPLWSHDLHSSCMEPPLSAAAAPVG